ncbi:hypothetical protein IC582_013915 [Cucumis melo]
MVRRSERCLGSRLNKIRSNKDDPIIDDNTKEEIRHEKPVQYVPLQTIYLEG